MWNFAAPRRPRRACARRASPRRAAGWSRSRCSRRTRSRFTSTVTLGPLLAQLPEELRRPFAEAVLEESEQPLVLDYVRLNIEAVAA